MKKVLIVTYYWPPAGGPGVQRWLKFVKYLRDFDIDPIVYVPENPDYPMLDNSLVQEIPEDITVLKSKIFEPYFLAKMFSKKDTSKISSGIIADEKKQSALQKTMLYIRGNFFIPDARRFWVKPSVNYLSKYISENKIDTVITTGPPHSVHLIGLKLKKKLNITWLADFRDPWTQIGYHDKLRLSQSSKKKHLALENKVLNTADEIIVTSYTTKSEFKKITEKPITVITNGYDTVPEEVEVNKEDQFTISHIGSLLSGRNPKVLWECLNQLVNENEEFAIDFQLKLIGAVSEDVINSIKKYELDPYLEISGYVPHDEALKIQRSASVLLLIEINSEDTKGIIPGKLFEYMAAKRPILAIGPKDWDVIQILEKTNSGVFFDYDDSIKLKEYIQQLYHLYKTNQLNSNSTNIEEYSRKSLTKQLAKLLN